ncbi:MAG: hypothetical protein JWO05_2667 [Gemmatimonadetes bacterium]|nr:hypothetical protein [Gemmatimonadota bacterium]
MIRIRQHTMGVLALLAASALTAPAASAQNGRHTGTPDFTWSGALASGKSVRLRNLSGDVNVSVGTGDKAEITGWIPRGDRNRDEVTIEVHQLSGGGLIACVVYKDMDSRCDDDGYHVSSHNDDRWGRHDHPSMDMEVRLPRGTIVDASSVSGDLVIIGAEGDVRGTSVSGDVRLEGLHATSVEARSVSGDVKVEVLSLADGRGDLTFKSVSGDIEVSLPRDLNANVTMKTVSGDFNSDFPLTLDGRMNRRSIEGRVGKGGRELELTTVSGDVKLRMTR